MSKYCLEAIFPTSPDREIFYFLERETNKLEELAWSDQVLQRTVSIAGISSVNALRNGILQLSQPGDGGWKLYATSTDPHIAKIIANAWGDAFEEVVREGADIERSVLAIQTTLAAGSVTDTVELDRLSHDLTELQQSSLGIHPLLQITRSQKSDIQVIRKSSQGLYIFSGAMITLMITLIMVLLFPPKTESGHEN